MTCLIIPPNIETDVWLFKQGDAVELLNSRDLAAYLKLSISTIKTYRSRSPEKLPPSFRMNGQYRWDKAEVDYWVNQKARNEK